MEIEITSRIRFAVRQMEGGRATLFGTTVFFFFSTTVQWDFKNRIIMTSESATNRNITNREKKKTKIRPDWIFSQKFVPDRRRPINPRENGKRHERHFGRRASLAAAINLKKKKWKNIYADRKIKTKKKTDHYGGRTATDRTSSIDGEARHQGRYPPLLHTECVLGARNNRYGTPAGRFRFFRSARENRNVNDCTHCGGEERWTDSSD